MNPCTNKDRQFVLNCLSRQLRLVTGQFLAECLRFREPSRLAVWLLLSSHRCSSDLKSHLVGGSADEADGNSSLNAVTAPIAWVPISLDMRIE